MHAAVPTHFCSVSRSSYLTVPACGVSTLLPASRSLRLSSACFAFLSTFSRLASSRSFRYGSSTLRRSLLKAVVAQASRAWYFVR